MVATANRRMVAAPTVTPLPYGLLSVAQPADDTDPHWQNGVAFQADVCDEAGITIMSCPTPPADKEPTSDGLPTRGGEPFSVYAWIDCAAPGFTDEMAARVSAALTNGEARAVEREFWTGAAGTRPHLAENTADAASFGAQVQTAATALTSGAVDIVEAMGLMHGAIGECYGSEGVIHVPFGLVPLLAAWNQIERDGQRLRTAGGLLVAAGAGYPGTTPAGAAAPSGTAYIYGTGAVKLWRSGITAYTAPADVVDRSKNNTVAIAERTYVIGWDCCHFAAQVSTGGVVGGTSGAAT